MVPMTPAQLQSATNCATSAALRFAQPLTVAIERWHVGRIPEFLAQIAVESGYLANLEENLRYTTAKRLLDVFPRYFKSIPDALPYVNNPVGLANYVYADENRVNKLGNVEPGDGWKYRGRGLKQVTGRDNYSRYQTAANVSCVENPDLLLDPVAASDSAAWFWSSHNCDSLADDTQKLTQCINGGLNGLQERIQLTAVAREAFKISLDNV